MLVSACLLGENCKYNGSNNKNEKVIRFLENHEVIPVCPEVLGGLPVPRSPAEIVNGMVMNAEGVSVDCEFRAGAMRAFDVALGNHVDAAILQSRSPSCGVKQIYDGSFSGKKIEGQGIFAKLLSSNGIKVIDAEDVL